MTKNTIKRQRGRPKLTVEQRTDATKYWIGRAEEMGLRQPKVDELGLLPVYTVSRLKRLWENRKPTPQTQVVEEDSDPA